MKTLILIILLLASPLFANVVHGQTDDPLKELERLVLSSPAHACDLTVDKVPLIRGLRLGQPFKHLKTILPTRFDRLEFQKADEYGLRRAHISPAILLSPDSLTGIQSMSLTYFDDSLKSIEISYTRDIKWESNLHFVATIAEQLNLPRQGWQQRDPSYLLCRGFYVEVAYAKLMPTLRVFDTHFTQEVEKRMSEVEEKKRARFRP